jgi:hypothetical protein
LEIIYGRDLYPFIKFYLKEITQKSLMKTVQTKESSYSDQNILPEMSVGKNSEYKNLNTSNEEEYNPLMKYLTKGILREDLSVDQVM